ncbi:hypothetical protein A203_16590 [Chromobacterium violaceum]|uniref:DUF551 domain-containing protein n=1 Tax=Chromobacterium violaceum TaxID=536 RepID=UPI003CF38D79
MQTLTQLARAIIAADRAGELTDELFNEFELALDATEQHGEAVVEMWAVYFDGEGTRYSSGFVTPWKLYEHQEAAQAEVDSLSDLPGRYMARKVFIYTRPQTAPVVPDCWRDVVRDLVALAQVVSIALDDSEERQGDEGRVHLIDSDNFDEVCGALDKLDELPDDKPGYTLGPAGKAEWVLRRLLSSTPATAEDSSVDQPAAAFCECHAFQPITLDNMRMVLCPVCGNKRCPHANDHHNACTGSNEPGQIGSFYTAAPQPDQQLVQWLDIDSAPQDGRTILLGYHNSHGKWRTMRGQWFTRERIDDEWEDADCFQAGWYETSVEADDAPSCWLTNPTHWMPLPAAPQLKEGGV